MSLVFEKIVPLTDILCKKFETVSKPVEEEGLKGFDWFNKVYTSPKLFRRGHVEVLDRREKNNMWILHSTIFPHIDDNAPIFGLRYRDWETDRKSTRLNSSHRL